MSHWALSRWDPVHNSKPFFYKIYLKHYLRIYFISRRFLSCDLQTKILYAFTASHTCYTCYRNNIRLHATFEVLTAVLLQTQVAPCN